MGERKRVHVIATQHLDVAWLWTRAPQGEDLMRQCFERAIEMIEQYPEERFVFSRSTAWSFWIVEQRYPKLFEQVKRYVAEDRIELCGGEWVEPDHLIPDGESMVRQSALGQWYYQEAFGKTASVCWVPDIFGHANTLPQIFLKSGLEGYYFHRCRPRDDEGRTLHQFLWEGPDGSQVYALSGQWIQRPCEDDLRAAVLEMEGSGLPATHVAIGRGSDRQIIMQRDWTPLPSQLSSDPEMPECKWSSSDEVLQEMKAYRDQLPVVSGELGFQFTGTYTSNDFNKRAIRRLEALLLNAEKVSSWASLGGFAYPAEQLTTAWRDFCVNQFHDIICGCSYGNVHEEDRPLFDEVERRAQWALDESLDFMSDRIHAALPEGKRDNAVAVFDTVAWPRESPAILSRDDDALVLVRDSEGNVVPSQAVVADDGQSGLLVVNEGSGVGATLYHLEQGAIDNHASQIADGFILENNFVRAEIDPTSGEITRLLDKRSGRECLPEGGRGNRLTLLREEAARITNAGFGYDPWNIVYTGEELDRGQVVDARVIETGPVRGRIRIERRIQIEDDLPETVVVQDIILYSHSPMIHFETHGQWQARRASLRANFDLSFTCDRVAVEAPYGVVERAPHVGSAQAELDADSAAEDGGSAMDEPDRYMQKWLDVGDGERGLLLVNNGKYGYDTAPDRVGLSLLRAPVMRIAQDEITGLGAFDFSYAIAPHEGGWRDIDAPRQGYDFNYHSVAKALRPAQAGYQNLVGSQWWDLLDGKPVVPSQFIRSEGDGVLVTVAKQAEDGDGFVIRLVETLGRSTTARLLFAGDIESATECDLLERSSDDDNCSVLPTTAPQIETGGRVTVEMSPFEIKTLRARLR